MDTAKLLVRIGAILGIILGIASAAIYGLWLATDLAWGSFSFVFDAAFLAMGIVSIICAFIVYTKYLPQMETDPKSIVIYLIIFGILMMFGTWGIGGLLVLIGGILILVESEEA